MKNNFNYKEIEKLIDEALEPLTGKHDKSTDEITRTLFGETIMRRKDLIAQAVLPAVKQSLISYIDHCIAREKSKEEKHEPSCYNEVDYCDCTASNTNEAIEETIAALEADKEKIQNG